MTNEPWIPNVPRPVRPKPSFVDRHLGIGVRLTAIVLGVLIVKPWTFGAAGSEDLPSEEPTPTANVTPAPVHVGFEDFAYDPNIFGTHEPTPHWDLWPAAYLVTYGFVIQLGGPSAAPVPVPVGSPPPVRVPPAASSAAIATAPADGGPAWPSSFTVPAGYHVTVIGIDMPTGISLVSATLHRGPAAAGALPQDVALAYPPSPWPDHFVVLGIPAASGEGRLATWTPGTYALDLEFAAIGRQGGLATIDRSIQIVIEAPPVIPGAAPSPAPSE